MAREMDVINPYIAQMTSMNVPLMMFFRSRKMKFGQGFESRSFRFKGFRPPRAKVPLNYEFFPFPSMILFVGYAVSMIMFFRERCQRVEGRVLAEVQKQLKRVNLKPNRGRNDGRSIEDTYDDIITDRNDEDQPTELVEGVYGARRKRLVRQPTGETLWTDQQQQQQQL